MKYELPVDLMAHSGRGMLSTAGSGILSGGASFGSQGRLDAALKGLSGAYEYKALGDNKARQIFNQVSSIAPNLIEKNPSVALSVMQNVATTGSTMMTPDIAQKLVAAEKALTSS